MLKFSTKGRYGIRLMLNLARHYGNGKEPTILNNVSKEEEISIRYSEQLIIPLKNNKIVKSIRGAGGGYVLARHPSEIRLVDIIETLEGTICLVDCVEDSDYCNRIPTCAAHEIWKNASFMLRDYFEGMTLQDLIKIWNKKNPHT